MNENMGQPATVLKDRYLLETTLHEGIEDVLYLAWDQLFQRKVLIQKSLFQEKEQKKAFLELGEKLLHLDEIPGLLNVFAVFEEAETAYRIMEYPGEITIEKIVKERGALEFDDVQWMLEEYARGLNYAHSIGVYHEQITPSCCYMTSSGELKLGIFGNGQNKNSFTGITADIKGLAWLAIYALTGSICRNKWELKETWKTLRCRCTQEAYETLVWSVENHMENSRISIRRFVDLFCGDATIELTE